MEFAEAVRRRRMVRNFEDRPVDADTVGKVLARGVRAPSAGFTQGVDLLVLEDPADRDRFWRVTTTPEWRAGAPRAARLMRAPVVVIPVCDPGAYGRRYAEEDKAGSGLADPDDWPVPYWWVDAAFTAMTIFLGAVDAGVGAGFLGMFRGEAELLRGFGVPEGRRALGAILIGHPAEPDPPSRSVERGRRPLGETIHRGRW